MNLARYATRVAVRRVVALVVLALLAYAGIGEAHAACTGSGTSFSCTYKDEAYNKALTLSATQTWWSSFCAGTYTGMKTEHDPTSPEWDRYALGSGCGGQRIYAEVQYTTATCTDSTKVWDEALKTCVAPGPTPVECAARPALGAVSVVNATGTPSTCQSGCYFAPDVESNPNLLFSGFTTNGTTWTYVATGWMATGDTCPVSSSDPAAAPLQDNQTCADIEGTTTCLRNDGKLCHEASTGRYICWTPGETGTKTDGPIAQVRYPGTSPGPAPTPPPGETLTQVGTPLTTTTNTNSGNSTTTINNYTTTNGTNAGGSGSPSTGEPSDGSDAGSDEEEGSATGGDTCASPPVVSDALFSKVSEMMWRLRCAGETGEGELDPATAGAQGDDPHPTVDSIVSTSDLAAQIAQGGDDSGIAGMTRTCPALDWPELTLFGETVAAPWPALCDVFAIISAMVLLAGHIQWAFIVGRIGTA